MRIYIFSRNGEEYETLAVVEGAGTAVYSVEYAQLNDTPFKELVVSWQMSSQLSTLAAYSIAPGGVEILRTDYDAYELDDLDQDNQQELVVIRAAAVSESGRTVAVSMKYWLLQGAFPFSSGITDLASGGVRAGYLVDRVPGIFVTSTYGENGTITDILTYRGGEFRNVTLNPESGESGETIRYDGQVSETDINGDGIWSCPESVPVMDYRITSTTVNFWLIHWRQFDANGRAREICTTYHNERDGWYLILPKLGGTLTMTRSDVPGGGERSVTFYYWEGDEAVEPKSFLTIYRLSGTDRLSRASSDGRFLLDSGAGEVVYAAQFRDGWGGLWADRRRGQRAVPADQAGLVQRILNRPWRRERRGRDEKSTGFGRRDQHPFLCGDQPEAGGL